MPEPITSTLGGRATGLTKLAAAIVADFCHQSDFRDRPSYLESLMDGIARSEINSRGLAKTDFAEIKFHRMAEAPLYGLKLGRHVLAVASAEEARSWTATNGGRIVFTSASVPLRALTVQPETRPAGRTSTGSGAASRNGR